MYGPSEVPGRIRGDRSRRVKPTGTRLGKACTGDTRCSRATGRNLRYANEFGLPRAIRVQARGSPPRARRRRGARENVASFSGPLSPPAAEGSHPLRGAKERKPKLSQLREASGIQFVFSRRAERRERCVLLKAFPCPAERGVLKNFSLSSPYPRSRRVSNRFRRNGNL